MIAALSVCLLLLAFAPQWWVRYTLRKYSVEMDNIPGTGGELATHLAQRFDLTDLNIAEAPAFRDCYDPASQTVYLGPDHFGKRSLAAVAVAAHEVGHALQFYRDEPVSRLRRRYIPLAIRLKRIGVMILVAAPVIFMLVKAPSAFVLVLGASFVLQLLGALAYLIVLPEEMDASFGKALPILTAGGYIAPDQEAAVRQLLKAAALSYFAGALAEILNISRWLLVLRR